MFLYLHSYDSGASYRSHEILSTVFAPCCVKLCSVNTLNMWNKATMYEFVFFENRYIILYQDSVDMDVFGQDRHQGN